MDEVLAGNLDVLKAEARKRSLSQSGTKADVRNRIVADMVSKDEGVPKQFAPLTHPDSVREGTTAGGLTAEELQDQEAAQQAADALDREEAIVLEEIARKEAVRNQQGTARLAALRARSKALDDLIEVGGRPMLSPLEQLGKENERPGARPGLEQDELQRALAENETLKALLSGKKSSGAGGGSRHLKGKSEGMKLKHGNGDGSDSDSDDYDDEAEGSDEDDGSEASEGAESSAPRKSKLKFVQRSKLIKVMATSTSNGTMLPVGRIGENLYTSEGVRWIAADGSIMATNILGGRTAKKTPRLEITMVEGPDGVKVGAGQQRKDHSYKQGLPVRSLPQFEVFITETLTLLADMDGTMERKDLRFILRWACMIRQRWRTVCGPGNQKVGGKTFQYSDSAEMGVAVLHQYNSAMCAGDFARLPALVEATWPGVLQCLAAQNHGLHFDSTWLHVAHYHGLQCAVLKCGAPGSTLQICGDCEDAGRRPPEAGREGSRSGDRKDKLIKDPAFKAWSAANNPPAGQAIRMYEAATSKKVIREAADTSAGTGGSGGGGGGGGGGRVKGPMDITALHAYLADGTVQAQQSPAPFMGTAVGAGP